MSALNDWVIEARIQYSSLNMAAEKQVLTFQFNVSFIFSSSCVGRLMMDSNLLGVSPPYLFAIPMPKGLTPS